MVGVGSALSVAVTVKLTVCVVAFELGGRLTVMSAGQSMTGASSSVTVTLKLHESSGATPLVAVHMTVVSPSGNVCGEVMLVAPILQSMVGVGVPVAVTLKETEAVETPGSVPTLMSAGQEMSGGTPRNTGVTVGSPDAPVSGSSVCTEPPVYETVPWFETCGTLIELSMVTWKVMVIEFPAGSVPMLTESVSPEKAGGATAAAAYAGVVGSALRAGRTTVSARPPPSATFDA